MKLPKEKSHKQIRMDKCTPEYIMGIARQRGYFTVSWRYSDDWLVRRCHKMVKNKQLHRMRVKAGNYCYVLDRSQFTTKEEADKSRNKLDLEFSNA